MNSHELLAKMLEVSAIHIDSLECYEDFPGVPLRAVDETKFLVQLMLRKLASRERLLTQCPPDKSGRRL